MTKPRDSEIYKQILEGNSIKSICEKYEISRDKVRRVRDNATEYINIDTGEVEIFGYKGDYKEDMFHILYDYCLKREGYIKEYHSSLCEKIPLVYQKSLLKRLSEYCGISYDKAIRLKNIEPYVLLATYDIKSCIITEYDNKFEQMFRDSFYYVDDMGFYKGFKLYYINYHSLPEFSYYINLKVFSIMDSLEEVNYDTFVNKNKGGDFKEYLASKVAVLIHKWSLTKIRAGYKEDEIRKCLKSNERYTKIEYSGDLSVPYAIYYESKGFEELSKEMQLNMIMQVERGMVLGNFEYNPMEFEVHRLVRKAS